jgi:hypothetical protein
MSFSVIKNDITTGQPRQIFMTRAWFALEYRTQTHCLSGPFNVDGLSEQIPRLDFEGTN